MYIGVLVLSNLIFQRNILLIEVADKTNIQKE